MLTCPNRTSARTATPRPTCPSFSRAFESKCHHAPPHSIWASSTWCPSIPILLSITSRSSTEKARPRRSAITDAHGVPKDARQAGRLATASGFCSAIFGAWTAPPCIKEALPEAYRVLRASCGRTRDRFEILAVCVGDDKTAGAVRRCAPRRRLYRQTLERQAATVSGVARRRSKDISELPHHLRSGDTSDRSGRKPRQGWQRGDAAEIT